jgi:hypothetical protein
MGISKTNHRELSENHTGTSLKDIDSFMKNTEGLLEKLMKKTTELPKVDKDGQSECPFAENLFAEKDEHVETAVRNLKEMRGYLAQMEKLIDRHRRNLDQIRADSGELQQTSLKENYAFAEVSQEFYYKRALQRRKMLHHLITWTERVLTLARAKKFPGKKPQKQFRLPPPLPGTMAPSVVATHPPSSPFEKEQMRPPLHNEISSLMSVAPLGGKFAI